MQNYAVKCSSKLVEPDEVVPWCEGLGPSSVKFDRRISHKLTIRRVMHDQIYHYAARTRISEMDFKTALRTLSGISSCLSASGRGTPRSKSSNICISV